MKFLHLGDLHLGKRVYGYSMLDDQRFALEQVVRMAAQNRVDAVVIAGDIYDKTVPPGEAVSLFDWIFHAAVRTKYHGFGGERQSRFR